MSYVDAWVKQKSHFLARTGPDRLDPVGDGVMFVEHEPVYTVGRGGTLNNLKFDALAPGDGPACLRVDRGGEVTWHGPGQLVVYPLLALPNFKKDIRWFVCRVEDVIIGTAAQYGLKAHRMEGSPGVWLGNNKIAAVGVAVSKWHTQHGFALNVDPDFSYFDRIVPCGLVGRGVTSLSREVGRVVAMDEVKARVAEQFEKVFGVTLTPAPFPDVPLCDPPHFPLLRS